MGRYAVIFKYLVAAAFLSTLSGCAAISALDEAATPLEVYELRAPDRIPAVRGRPYARDVIVELPTTGGALDTDRIMIRPTPLQAQYLPDVRWGEPTPVMVQTLMVRSIEATGGVRYVAREPLGPSGDFAIVTELIDFQAELGPDGETAAIQLRLVSRMVREDDASIVASRTFTAAATSASVETQDLVEAFDVASNALFTDFAAWVLATLGGR